MPVRCYVDIMFVKSCGLWPSWHIPGPLASPYIDSVEATIRLFEPTKDLDPSFSGSMRSGKDVRGPPSAVWDFYKMLVALFVKPGFPFREDSLTLENFEPNYVVRELTIDILAPTDGYPHRSVIFSETQLTGGVELGEGVIFGSDHDAKPPEFRLATFLGWYFNFLYRVRRDTEYWAIIYECVTDRIVFRVNGIDYDVYNIDTMIEVRMGHDFNDSDPIRKETRLHNVAVWKAWLDERRSKMKRGLPLGHNPRPVTLYK
ncbi:unnamed protein product [Clonostachys rosea]|uniref:GH16 domain-containing protein n=1 Tax=Bionectria ochroleuca TaxID=29856 RepID=A0ABY6U3H8_BIOOC|nr:unnamed protein product [Clonostachys rosea]